MDTVKCLLFVRSMDEHCANFFRGVVCIDGGVFRLVSAILRWALVAVCTMLGIVAIVSFCRMLGRITLTQLS